MREAIVMALTMLLLADIVIVVVCCVRMRGSRLSILVPAAGVAAALVLCLAIMLSGNGPPVALWGSRFGGSRPFLVSDLLSLR